MEEDFKTSNSEWNMAKATLMRMNQCLINCVDSYIQGNGISRYKNLVSLYLEVQAVLTQEEDKKAMELLNLCTTHKNKIIRSKTNQINSNEFNQSLFNLQKYIIQMMAKHDIYLPFKEDGVEALKRMR
jgi:hypothetical protein